MTDTRTHAAASLRLVVTSIALQGCYASAVPAPAPSLDAGALGRDAAAPRDAFAPPDPPPADVRLGDAISCGLDGGERMVRAAARLVACRERGTVSQLVELWEAGLWSGIEPSGGAPGLDGIDLGCDAWACLASIGSCAEVDACRARPGGPCEPYARACRGTEIVTCDRDGAALVHGFDCASVGATCEGGSCVLGGCRFGAEHYALVCDGDDLVLCDGAVRLDCAAWREGTACAPFHVGGEVPIAWCSPGGESAYGGYERPVECDGRTIRFESQSSRQRYELDCVAAGYPGCDERGCTP